MKILSYADRIYQTNNRGSLEINNLVDSNKFPMLWQAKKIKEKKPPLYTKHDHESKIIFQNPLIMDNTQGCILQNYDKGIQKVQFSNIILSI